MTKAPFNELKVGDRFSIECVVTRAYEDGLAFTAVNSGGGHYLAYRHGSNVEVEKITLTKTTVEVGDRYKSRYSGMIYTVEFTGDDIYAWRTDLGTTGYDHRSFLDSGLFDFLGNTKDD